MQHYSEQTLNSAGTFDCRVEMPATGWFVEIGAKATPCVRIPLVVCEGPLAGQRATFHAWLTPNAFERTLATLAACFRFDGDFAALAADPHGFAGMKCRVVTEMEEFQGRFQCKVKWLNASGQLHEKPLDARRVASLVSRLSTPAAGPGPGPGAAMINPAPRPMPPSWRDAEADPDGCEDDIPF